MPPPSRATRGPLTRALRFTHAAQIALLGVAIAFVCDQEPEPPPEWIRIPAGSFEMGSEDGESDERPVHTVTLKAFEIQRTEVTVEQYMACVAGGGCSEPHWDDGECRVLNEAGRWEPGIFPKDWRSPSLPVVCVDHPQAQAYCAWREARLPSEAEWEYAARGGDGRIYPWGDEAPGAGGALRGNFADESAKRRYQGWGIVEGYDDGFPHLAPVGTFPRGASAFGVLDMAGNVWEWVDDCYRDSYSEGPVDGSSRTDICTDSSDRVIRGGSFHDDGGNLRAPDRNLAPPGYAYFHLGVRCSRSLP